MSEKPEPTPSYTTVDPSRWFITHPKKQDTDWASFIYPNSSGYGKIRMLFNSGAINNPIPANAPFGCALPYKPKNPGSKRGLELTLDEAQLAFWDNIDNMLKNVIYNDLIHKITDRKPNEKLPDYLPLVKRDKDNKYPPCLRAKVLVDPEGKQVPVKIWKQRRDLSVDENSPEQWYAPSPVNQNQVHTVPSIHSLVPKYAKLVVTLEMGGIFIGDQANASVLATHVVIMHETQEAAFPFGISTQSQIASPATASTPLFQPQPPQQSVQQVNNNTPTGVLNLGVNTRMDIDQIREATEEGTIDDPF